MQRQLITTLTTLALLVAAGAAHAGKKADDKSDKFEQDRKAILAMAGEFKITFDFEETVALRPGYELKKPYHAEATEFVEVVEDDGDRIVLQHILVLTNDDGEKRVVKHWRQEWKYEDRLLFEFKGNRTWEPRKLSADEARGTWTQQVFQVDDSPRYEGYGKWVHNENVSSWESNETWRPLPRREYTKRDDYHVLVARNRHTLTPDGWVHEQDNYKLVLGEDDSPILAREIGLNRYSRVSDVDFKPGRDYWASTSPYWADVRSAWQDIFAKGKTVQLRDEVDESPMWQHMFAYAEQVAGEKSYDEKDGRAFIDETLAQFTIRD